MAAQHEALAAELAKRFSADGMDETIATMVATNAVSRVTFDSLGLPVNLGEAVAAAKQDDAELIGMFSAKPAPNVDNRTPMQRDMDSARSAAAAAREERVAAIKASGNPFSGRHWNLSKQAILMNFAPHLAEQLRAEARS